MTDKPLVITGLKPKRGNLTFGCEGNEGGRYHSRKLHVPSHTSGVTIGRGYDMKTKSSAQIQSDLCAVGVNEKDAKIVSGAAGKYGEDAKKFIKDSGLEGFEISSESQVQLFERSYAAEAATVRHISNKEDVKKTYGVVDWNKTHPAVEELVVDLKFRGDYNPKTRKIVQQHLANNDLEKLAEVMSSRENWPNVPSDRFEQRRSFISKAAAERRIERQNAEFLSNVTDWKWGTRTPMVQVSGPR